MEIKGYMGMPYEDLVQMVKDYEWLMDCLYVTPDGNRWYAIELTNWTVSGWERV